ncbi:hypothetical protein CXT76_01230 [Candidatus Parvarchaeota archaeon]|jgi:hypothetical protein|nr:MAG: hypothetical protein CXT76_01230 [Candidatus Parvarchaeota archaeon]HIG52013.1 hypothetical protein [Candidatus Pacearchaeota archaeon]
MKLKKGQAWGFDLMIAISIFMIGIVGFYLFSLNSPSEGRDTLDSLFYDGNLIADSLLSEGYPENWDSNSVINIGIVNDNRINETKLQRLYDLTISDYSRTKNLFNTRFNYYFNFSRPITMGGVYVEFIGQKDLNPDNIIKIQRFVIFENNPVTLNVYVWS